MSLHEKFSTERVFPSPAGFGTGRAINLPVLPPSTPTDTTSRTSVCLIGHSILDDLRLLLSSKDVDLHDDLNLLTVSPVWNTVRGLTFPAFVDTCLEFLDSNRPDIVFLQFAGNDLDSTSSVTDITERYLCISYSLWQHCSTKIVIICEALPCSKTRHCTVADYAQRCQHFNSSLKSALILPDAPKGRLSSTFVDPQVWFWSHEKLQGGCQLKDGVHLTPQGLRRLYFSVRMVLRMVLSWICTGQCFYFSYPLFTIYDVASIVAS